MALSGQTFLGLPGDGFLRKQMGPSAQVQTVIDNVKRIARTPFSVLIYGETGTGKELVARAAHQKSARRGNPFVALDCGPSRRP